MAAETTTVVDTARTQVKRTVAEALVGSAVGFIVWSFMGPGMIGWWYEPPSKDAFSCAGSVKTALGQFITMQIVFAFTGAVVIAIAMFFGRRWWAKRKLGKQKTQNAPASP
jgi:hypothetical protein